MQMELSNALQDIFINDLIKNKAFVSVYLKNSIRLKGNLIYHNDKSVILRNGGIQMIFKAVISTISPEIMFDMH
jgi:host factor-I protein